MKFKTSTEALLWSNILVAHVHAKGDLATEGSHIDFADQAVEAFRDRLTVEQGEAELGEPIEVGFDLSPSGMRAQRIFSYLKRLYLLPTKEREAALFLVRVDQRLPGKKIAQIKEFREHFPVGLKEAKELVELAWRTP